MQNDRALFLYGFDVTAFNRYINFTTNLGTYTAILDIGNYTATEFMTHVSDKMELIEGTHTFTLSLNRTTNANTSNRMSIVTNATTFQLLFSSGVNAANSPRVLMGFDAIDYTGLLSYTGYTNAGKIWLPEFPTYNWIPPEIYFDNDGVKNVSAAGIKETLVFAQMYFCQGQWKYITNFGGRTQKTEYSDFMKYVTKQLKFELTPSIYEDPNLFYQVTLESSPANNKGMGMKGDQMIGQGLYRFYDSGVLKFRLIP